MAVVIAPEETAVALSSVSKKQKELPKEPNKDTFKQSEKILSEKNIPKEESVGLIRRCKRQIIESSKKFWKWLY